MRSCIVVLIIVGLWGARSAHSQVSQPFDSPTSAQPSSEAVGRLRSSIGNIDSDLSDFLHSEAFRRETIREAAGIDPKASDENLPRIEIQRMDGPGVAGLKFQVKSYDPKVPAEKVLESLKDVVTDMLRKLDDFHLRKMVQRDVQGAQLESLAANLQKERDSLLALAKIHHVELNPAVATEKRIRLEAELERLDIEFQGLEARRTVLEQQIAELGKQVESGLSADPVVLRELAKSVEARKRILEAKQAQFNSNNITVDVVETARDQLAQAEAELARYRRAAADAAGGQRVMELRRRLEDTAIELAEIRAKQKIVKELAAAAGNQSPQIEIKQMQLELMEQLYRQASEQFNKLNLEVQQYVPPTVTLIPLSHAAPTPANDP